MSRRRPLDFPEPEPVANYGPVPLPQITRGSELFAELTGITGGLPQITERSALTVSAVYACVSLIAGVIACLPLRTYTRSPDGELTELHDDPLWWIFNEQMVPRWSAHNGWEFIGQAKLLRGDGYGRIRRSSSGAVVGVEPVHYDRVQPIPTPDGARLIYAIAPDWTIPQPLQTGWDVIDQDDMLHFAGFGFDGVRGLSPLRYWLRMTGAVALSAQEYSARFFANGARPDYMLSTDGKMAPESVALIRDQIGERHQGVDNAHKPMIGTQGLKPYTLGLPAEDMQLLGTRQFSVEEVCRIFGVPPFMVGANEKTTSWGSGVAAMGEGFVRYVLRRHLNKFENEINRKVFRTSAKVALFDTTDLEKADFTTLVTALRTGLGRAGEDSMFSVEEIRMLLKLPRKPAHGTLGKGTGNAPDQAAQPAGQ